MNAIIDLSGEDEPSQEHISIESTDSINPTASVFYNGLELCMTRNQLVRLNKKINQWLVESKTETE